MNDKTLTKFILSYLVHKDDYVKMDTDQQQLIFQTCKTIMMAIYNSIKYDNVHPVIYCGDAEAQHVISKAIGSVRNFLPSTDKITIHLIH
tara:strand:+ start:575 stop:844 length:270 start_codon:yes stop_codon:yes gene_type:complete